MSLPEGTTIREGCYYRRRDGKVVGPATLRDEGTAQPWFVGDEEDGAWHTPEGRYAPGYERGLPRDLIAEAPVVIDPLNLAADPAPLLPVDSQERKDAPVYSGVLAYFPLALVEIAKLSKAGNDKHNPGEPLHWSRGKSNDHPDCAVRHLLEIGTIDPDDGHRHSTKLAWRALAILQLELEAAAAKS